jgi:hypothetical protein
MKTTQAQLFSSEKVKLTLGAVEIFVVEKKKDLHTVKHFHPFKVKILNVYKIDLILK